MRGLRLPGQSLTEYAFGIGLVALVAVVGLVNLSNSINQGFLSILPAKQSSKTTVPTLQGGNMADIPTASASELGSQAVANITAADIQTEHSSVVQVSGSNGGSETVQANSQKLLAIAAKYKDLDPALANLIEQLAQKGYGVASSMTYYAASGGIEDPKNPIGGPNGACPQYKSLWDQVLQSPEYSNLSADDQALVNSLAEDSYSRASDVFFAGAMQLVGQKTTTNMSSSAQVVNSNSRTIQTCSGGVCNNSGN